MKKRNIIVSLLLTLTLMLTACGEPSPFIGTWRGTCDLTDVIIGESNLVADEEWEQYVEHVEGLEFVITFEFTEDKMAMSVDEASVDTFMKNFENSMKNMMEAYMIDEFSAYGISYEEYLEEVGMSSDAFLQSMLDEMNMSAQMKPMMESMAEALDLNGSYMYDEEKITIVYEDNTYEEMLYVFDGENLTITFVDEEGTEFDIECELQN
ncbi:MAG: hypothetical protein IJD24_05745 [Agathobacter sp.]|nr:hypothetical protein [Agathobacter sp.]